mmetsp:Transcript_10969/g.9327  ORF Transcript_10969/g.9327 Transcript_10969/m.9327 type:complete len:162 (-) Transcript_10969:2-487(-)
MTPMDFLEFRDFLTPASGFQSVQFRIIEVMMGLPLSKTRRMYGSPEFFTSKFHPSDLERALEWENRPSLAELTEKWLERLPLPNFDWLSQYKSAVYAMLDSDEQTVKQVFGSTSISDEESVDGEDEEHPDGEGGGGCPFFAHQGGRGAERLEQELQALGSL